MVAFVSMLFAKRFGFSVLERGPHQQDFEAHKKSEHSSRVFAEKDLRKITIIVILHERNPWSLSVQQMESRSDLHYLDQESC